MAFFVMVNRPMKRARIHAGDCKYCRDGQGQEQNKGAGRTCWHPAYPEPGYRTVSEAWAFMDALGRRYDDASRCSHCMKDHALA
jgi:hypothetical protein